MFVTFIMINNQMVMFYLSRLLLHVRPVRLIF